MEFLRLHVKKGETPVVLDPADRAIPDLSTDGVEGRSILRNVVIFLSFNILRFFNNQAMDEVQNQESFNIILSPKTFREECLH
jgi:hypothetical protein